MLDECAKRKESLSVSVCMHSGLANKRVCVCDIAIVGRFADINSLHYYNLRGENERVNVSTLYRVVRT